MVLLVVAAGVAALVGNALAVDGGAGGKCTLPSGGASCPLGTDAECEIYNAVCRNTTCVCPGGTGDGGAVTGDGGSGGTGGSGGGGSGGTGGGGGNSNGTPITGGGMTFPSRSGCSYVPGQR